MPAALAFSPRRLWLVLLCGLTAARVLAAAPPSLDAALSADGTRLVLQAVARPDAPAELRITTPGLRHLETSAGVGEPGIIYLPPPEPGEALTPPAELYFFFHTLREADEWELVIRFQPGTAGQWALNGRFSPWGGALADEIVVPVAALERGENLLHVRTPILATPTLEYRRQLAPAVNHHETIPVTFGWSGEVTLRQGPLAVTRVVPPAAAPARPVAPPPAAAPLPDRASLTAAALAVGRNLLAAQVDDPDSFFAGGFNLVYDAERQAHRMPHWVWSWGPSIHLLLALQRTAAVAEEPALAEAFRTAALAAAARSLAFEVTEAGHPAEGVSTVRWEPSRDTPNGWAEYISTADSLFLAGWGWMSAHRETGDPVYLARTRSLVAAAERLMGEYPVVPQDWIIERQRWTPHTLDESVFGMIGFRELFKVTQDPAVAAAGRRFLDSHLQHMGRESGLLERAWLREEDQAIWDPDIKGHAWVVEGYLDAHALSGEPRYLELARQLAERVMDSQGEDGSWTYLFHRPGPNDPLDDKGTAIWAYFFYELYKTTGDARHLAAGRRALQWCLARQYRGPNPDLAGALLHENGMAYVRRRPMSILYSTTFFGLALLEELALAER